MVKNGIYSSLTSVVLQMWFGLKTEIFWKFLFEILNKIFIAIAKNNFVLHFYQLDMRLRYFTWDVDVDVDEFFLTRLRENCYSFFIASYAQEMRQSLSQRNCRYNKQFGETKTLIYNSNLIRQSFQGYTVENGALPFLKLRTTKK